MMGFTHVGVGIVTTGMIWEAMGLSGYTTLIGAAIGGVGGMLPDIDDCNSILGRQLPILPLVINALRIEHRGFTHTPVCLLIFTAAAYIAAITWNLNIFYAASLCVGYATHILTDAITREGVRLFWPFFKGRIALTGIRTGGIVDYALGAAAYIAIISYIVNSHILQHIRSQISF